jgi:SM-20-related protein
MHAASILERLRSENGFVVLDDVFGAEFARQCRAEGATMLQQGVLQQSGVTNGIDKRVQTQSRGDMIAWLKQDGTDTHLQQVISQVEALRQALKPDIDTDSCGFMLACYPGKGTRYIKHRDCHPERPGRKLTVLYYLNSDWIPEHGGCLRIWPMSSISAGESIDSMHEGLCREEGATLLEKMKRDQVSEYSSSSSSTSTSSIDGEEPVIVEPKLDRMVIFVSTMEHEVLPAFSERFTLTTWLKNRASNQKWRELVQSQDGAPAASKPQQAA